MWSYIHIHTYSVIYCIYLYVYAQKSFEERKLLSLSHFAATEWTILYETKWFSQMATDVSYDFQVNVMEWCKFHGPDELQTRSRLQHTRSKEAWNLTLLPGWDLFPWDGCQPLPPVPSVFILRSPAWDRHRPHPSQHPECTSLLQVLLIIYANKPLWFSELTRKRDPVVNEMFICTF